MDSRLRMMLEVVVAPLQKVGAVPHGTRAFAPIASGRFDGVPQIGEHECECVPLERIRPNCIVPLRAVRDPGEDRMFVVAA